MRVSKILQHYFTKAAIISLYGVFFATQLFSITPDTGSNSSTVSFFSNHLHCAGAPERKIKDKPGITEKSTTGFRLNKRFHPTEWLFTYIPRAESAVISVTDIEQKSPFKEAALLSTFLLFELFRGPPAIA